MNPGWIKLLADSKYFLNRLFSVIFDTIDVSIDSYISISF